MPVRIYEISRKLGLENKFVLAKAKELGIPGAKVPSSILDKITADYFEDELRSILASAYSRGLQHFGLGNFKAFAGTQSIPVRPLTLIFGANSSGKSSIIHGLLLAREAVETGKADIWRTALGGDSLDLGGFRQYVHRRDASLRVELAAGLAADTLRGVAGRHWGSAKRLKVMLTVGMPLDDVGRPKPGELPRLVSYEVEADGRSVLRLSRRPEATMQLDRLDEAFLQPLVSAILADHTTAAGVEAGNKQGAVRSAVDNLIPNLRFTCQRLLPSQLLGEDIAAGRAAQLYPVGKASRTEDLVNAARLFVPRAIADLVRSINAALQTQLERLVYLGPLRSFPPRHLAFSEDTGPNWYAGGGYAWDVVRREPKVRAAVNEWLGSSRLQTRYEVGIRSLGSMEEMEQPLAEAIEGLPIEVVEAGYRPGHDSTGREHDGELPVYGVKNPQAEAERVLKLLRDRVGEKYDELVLMDLRTNTPVTHRDVGIGVSQVLPVLVHAYADKERIVAIEQPEIHLHPALQAELGDLFIESALGERKNTFLLETHSEHLILRILRRVRETTEKRLPPGATPVGVEDVSVLFVEPTDKGSIVRQMTVTPDGDFAEPWPGGFFAERLKDLP